MQRAHTMLSQTGSVFWITAALSTALVLWGVLFTSSFGAVTRASFSFIVSNLSWFYMIATTLFFMCYTMYKSMRADLRKQGRQEELEEESGEGAGAPSPATTARSASSPGK